MSISVAIAIDKVITLGERYEKKPKSYVSYLADERCDRKKRVTSLMQVRIQKNNSKNKNKKLTANS